MAPKPPKAVQLAAEKQRMRFSGVEPEAMTPEQRDVAQKMISGKRGYATGLMALLLHNAAFADHAQAVGEYLRFNGVIPGALRELAILMVATHWRCNHEWAVHRPIAEKLGLAPALIDALLAWPEELPQASPAEAMIYRYVRQFLTSGQIDDAIFNALRDQMGLEAVVELAGILGHYTMGAALLNAANMPVVDPSLAPFAAQ